MAFLNEVATTGSSSDRVQVRRLADPDGDDVPPPPPRHRDRVHQDRSILQRAVRHAEIEAGLAKRTTYHSFRPSFPAHLPAAGYDIRTVQELLGQRDVRPTMLCTHVLQRGHRGANGPADDL